MSVKWPKWWIVLAFVTVLSETALKYLAYLNRFSLMQADIEIVQFFDYSVSFNIVYVENRHSAFGMLRSVPTWANHALLCVSLVVLLWLTYQQMTSPDSTVLTRRGILCFLVGALGNMLDRLTVGAVVDYVDIRLGNGGYTLAWNISDLIINLGFAHVIYDLMTRKEVEKNK